MVTYQSLPVWALLYHWWAGSGVWGLCEGPSSCGSRPDLATAGRGRSKREERNCFVENMITFASYDFITTELFLIMTQYLNIVHTHNASTVVHVLLKIFFLVGNKESSDIIEDCSDKVWKDTITKNIYGHSPSTQTRESDTCQCGWCHAKWQCWRASGLWVETLEKGRTSFEHEKMEELKQLKDH